MIFNEFKLNDVLHLGQGIRIQTSLSNWMRIRENELYILSKIRDEIGKYIYFYQILNYEVVVGSEWRMLRIN